MSPNGLEPAETAKVEDKKSERNERNFIISKERMIGGRGEGEEV